jgi:hypothetical protein
MKSFLGCVVVAMLISNVALSAPAPASQKKPTGAAASPDTGTFDGWHTFMNRILPKKKGCFTATYPGTAWQEVPCTTAPSRTYGPRTKRSQSVGHGIDFEAQVAGLMSEATGSFDTVNVTSENDNANPDIYSLQLNSSYFTTPACAGAANPNNCNGWQQFIYSSGLQSAFVEYWLIYGAPCPAGWTTSGVSCVKNSAGAIPIGFQPVSNLKQMSLTGTVQAGGMDTISMTINGNTLSAMNLDSELSLANKWNRAEFGIFGDGGGDDATFNAGATMAVRTSVVDGTSNAPACQLESFTSETNSLDLVPPCCAFGGAKPAIVFWLSNNPGATSSCSGGTSIGDTHLTNFNGLYYDFQASGDFLLAETTPGFVVETRQRSGAPTWPNASVNKAVAMNLGATRAAVCLDPIRLVVDGRARELADGASLAFPGGAGVARGGNTYLFTSPGGESVSAEVNSGWINVAVSLDHLPQAKVYGLLGNANGNMGEDDLATRQRVVLNQPLLFEQLYHLYANSWRVSGRESLLSSQCGDGDVETGIPSQPFYAENLDPDLYRRARTFCTEGGVRDLTLLDACTLDTAVLGETAVRAYVRAHPPRAEVRVTAPGRK